MKKFSIALAAVVLVGAAGAAYADSLNARFGGSVAHSCTLTAGSDGAMVPNVDSDVLTSTGVGGSAASVTALATARGYKVSAIAPAAFTSVPAGETGAYTFAAVYSLSGPTTATNVAGATQTTLNRGSHTVSVNLDASKTAGVFSNGAYVAEVLVRCE